MSVLYLLGLILIWIITAIPLYLAVKLIGGKTSLIKVIFVNFLVGFLTTFLYETIGLWAAIVSFIAMLLVYKIAFRVGWIRAFLAWITQFILIAIFVVAGTLIGISLWVL
jgi:hypothetical protein